MINYDYFYFANLYNLEQIKEINNIIDDYESSNCMIDAPAAGKKSKVKILENKIFGGLLDIWEHSLVNMNRSYYNFDLYNEFPKYTHVNTYHVDDEYPWHRDSKSYSEKCDVKFTAILNISTEDYSGGEFELFLGTGNNQTITPLNNAGTLLVFPSFLYHRVTPITHGTRKTMNIWFEGPGFK
jgi:PKHD-type hydroxylase